MKEKRNACACIINLYCALHINSPDINNEKAVGLLWMKRLAPSLIYAEIILFRLLFVMDVNDQRSDRRSSSPCRKKIRFKTMLIHRYGKTAFNAAMLSQPQRISWWKPSKNESIYAAFNGGMNLVHGDWGLRHHNRMTDLAVIMILRIGRFIWISPCCVHSCSLIRRAKPLIPSVSEAFVYTVSQPLLSDFSQLCAYPWRCQSTPKSFMLRKGGCRFMNELVPPRFHIDDLSPSGFAVILLLPSKNPFI